MKKSTMMFGAITMAAALALAMTTTTTQAYAQQSRACPEGFTLNRGVCEAPAQSEQVCETGDLQDGACVEIVNTDPFCPGNFIFNGETDLCELYFTQFPDANGNCREPFVMVDGQCRFTQTAIPDCNTGSLNAETNQCESEEVVGQPITVYSCSRGTLNEASGLCEVKPGREK